MHAPPVARPALKLQIASFHLIDQRLAFGREMFMIIAGAPSPDELVIAQLGKLLGVVRIVHGSAPCLVDHQGGGYRYGERI